MSYAKAGELLDLATEIAAQRYGMSYSSIDQRSTAASWEGRRRNTQRVVRALEEVFGTRLVKEKNDQNELVVRLEAGGLKNLVQLEPEELAALDHAVTVLAATNAVGEADALQRLRTKVRLLGPEKKMSSIEVDYEALLSGSHVVARPGPSPTVAPQIMRPVTEAILSLRKLAYDYPGKQGMVRRVAHPYGVIFGHRAYLVALIDGASGTNPSRWRIDRMANVEVLEDASERPDDFELAAYAKRSFGAYHNEDEYGEVEWRFAPNVADHVRSYRFHPEQEIVDMPDGSVTVRFRSSGHLEMVWALYPWGDSVEVIKPTRVRQMVEGHRRGDFPSVP